MEKPQGKALAFDFGGTKLAAAVIDKATGKLTHYQRKQTPRDLGSQGSLDVICALGNELLEENSGADISMIGVSFGGPVSPDGRKIITSQHVKGWDDFPLPDILADRFGLPVFMENDANVAALGEWYYGAGEKCDNMFYFQVSTGIGAGIIINGKIYRGKSMAGEFGHLTVEEDGLVCACGKKGCLESYSSGWGIACRAKNIYEELSDDSVLRKLTHNQPELVTTELVFEAHRQGEEQIQALVRSAMNSLARALVDVFCILDPDRVVIGGGVAKSKDIILNEMNPFFEKFFPPFLKPHFDLRFSILDGNETLYGAALLTENRYR